MGIPRSCGKMRKNQFCLLNGKTIRVYRNGRILIRKERLILYKSKNIFCNRSDRVQNKGRGYSVS